MIEAILIDDEHFGRQALANALNKYCPQVNLLAQCETPQQGIETIRKLKPQLVFLDVQMPGMSGFDVLNQLQPIDFQVIFVTSYDRYAIKAIRFSAVDYLLKPLDIDDLVQAVTRANERIADHNTTHQVGSILHNVTQSSEAIEQVAVPTLEGIDFIKTKEIIYCAAEGGYTNIFLHDGSTQLISRTLKDFDILLRDSGFCRVHHNSLINLKHIQKYIKGEGGYVILTNDHHVDISRRKKDEFLSQLNKI